MSHDTLLHRSVRPLVQIAAVAAVTPNQITACRLATGLAAALCFALGEAEWIRIGAVLFVISALLDRADGDLARLTGQFSRHGHLCDLLSDFGSNAAVFIGLGLGAGRWEADNADLVLGVSAGLGIVVLFWQLHVLQLASTPHFSTRNRRVVFDPDDALLIVPVLVWFEWQHLVLLLAGIITPILAIGLSIAVGIKRLARGLEP